MPEPVVYVKRKSAVRTTIGNEVNLSAANGNDCQCRGEYFDSETETVYCASITS